MIRFLSLFFCSSILATSATVWTLGSPGITSFDFFKPPGADASDPANWDRLSPSVAITRLGTNNPRGIYNPLLESGYARTSSPAGTLWAFPGRNGNPASIMASDYASLNFSIFNDAHGGANAGQDGTLRNIIEQDAVLHLVAEDVYLDIKFTTWNTGVVNAGAFGYTRAQGTLPAVPEPSTAFLLALSPLLMLRSRR